MKRSIILPCLVTAFVALTPAGVALADNPHAPGTTGHCRCTGLAGSSWETVSIVHPGPDGGDAVGVEQGFPVCCWGGAGAGVVVAGLGGSFDAGAGGGG